MAPSSNSKPLPFPQMFASSAIAACTAEVSRLASGLQAAVRGRHDLTVATIAGRP